MPHARPVAPMLFVLVLAACGGKDELTSPPVGSAFVADAACAACHKLETEHWTGSHHQLAMQPATDATVLGNFEDASFERHGVTSRLYRKDGRFFARTDGPDGSLQDYEVTHAFGIDPLQQYLVDAGKGFYQVLPICWDVHERRWFHVYDEPIPHHDPLHWTSPLGNWNYMCAECHTTDLRRGFDVETLSYDTTFHEMHVGCQSCHGPGEGHVAWAEDVKDAAGTYAADDPKGLVVDMRAADPSVQIETCARCHARRNLVSSAFGHGDPLLDHYDPELLVAPLYFPDGQILDEVYVYGSFLQAKKHAQGVRCSDCHDPHTTRLREQDNALCVTCHNPDPPERFPTLEAKHYDARTHHHHPTGSEGSLCVACHMPATTYMQVDPRRDHSFRLPRPDLSESLGVPNPCTDCHEARDPAWAVKAIERWYPDGVIARRAPHYGTVLAAARRGDTSALAGLVALVRDPDTAAIVRATALRELGRFGSPLTLDTAVKALADEQGLVRMAAVNLLRDVLGRGASKAFRARKTDWLTPLLTDPLRSIRGEAARGLADVEEALPPASREAYDAALDEFIARQTGLADRADAWLNLGALRADQGNLAAAEQAYEQALRVDPGFVPVRFNLATLYNATGRNDEARTMLQEILVRHPESGEAHYSLGLLLAEMEEFGSAAASLDRAAGLMPGRPRIHYNRALVLQRLGRHPDAQAALESALRTDPQDVPAMQALALLHVERRNWSEARKWARRLLEQTRGSADARALMEHIERAASR